VKRCLLSLAAWFFLCPLHVSANPEPVHTVDVTNPALLVALQNIKHTLTTERTALAFENGASSKNCLDYSILLSQSPVTESVRNSEIRGEYLLCDSVRFISDRPFIARKKTLPRGFSMALFERLDLRTFPSSMRNRATDQAHSLKTLLQGQVQAHGSTLTIENNDHFFKLQIVGLVPAGRGPAQDWIVWVTDEVKGGNYRSYRTLIIRPPNGPSGSYTAALYP
jgi:hypothetical protein